MASLLPDCGLRGVSKHHCLCTSVITGTHFLDTHAESLTLSSPTITPFPTLGSLPPSFINISAPCIIPTEVSWLQASLSLASLSLFPFVEVSPGHFGEQKQHVGPEALPLPSAYVGVGSLCVWGLKCLSIDKVYSETPALTGTEPSGRKES